MEVRHCVLGKGRAGEPNRVWGEEGSERNLSQRGLKDSEGGWGGGWWPLKADRTPGRSYRRKPKVPRPRIPEFIHILTRYWSKYSNRRKGRRRGGCTALDLSRRPGAGGRMVGVRWELGEQKIGTGRTTGAQFRPGRARVKQKRGHDLDAGLGSSSARRGVLILWAPLGPSSGC